MPQAIDALDGFKFGCDPELFIVDSNETVVSAEGLIPGTKEEPYKVPYGAVQVDGMAAEFNIDPVETFEEFNLRIDSVMGTLHRMLPPGHRLRAYPSVSFSKKVWDATPDKAKELGCTPDFNAWTGDINPPPDGAKNGTLRTASGHIHIGWTEDADISDLSHVGNCRDLVKQLDWYLGGWSLQLDEDKNRRALYGKAGACRYKPYGVEYRVLSNFWVSHPTRRLNVWNRLQQAIWDMRDNFLPDKAVSKARGYDMNQALIESINTSQRNSLIERSFKFPLMGLKNTH